MDTAGVRGPVTATVDGLYYHLRNPDPKVITLNAVARGLSNTCRFAGQCERYYSVAEHSIHVSRLVERWAKEHLGFRIRHGWAYPKRLVHYLATAGFVHDAPEAFIHDITKPLKNELPDYQEIEEIAERVVLPVFGVDPELPGIIKHYDNVMLCIEKLQVQHNHDDWASLYGITELPELDIEFLGPEEAYRAFIARAAELGIYLA